MVPRQSYQDRAKRIADYYLRVDKDKQKVLCHFEDEGVPSRTVHRIINLFEKRGDVSFKRIPGRSKKLSPDEAHEKIASLFKENPKMPPGEVAKILGISRSTLRRILNQMRQEGKESFRAPSEYATCPTCRQRCDPEILESIRLRKTVKKERKPRAKHVVQTTNGEQEQQA